MSPSSRPRAAKLVTGEDAAEVLTVDRAMEAERVNLTIYQDRIKALREECRKLEYQERESRRAKAITKIKERLKRREALALQLQEAVETVGRLYSELMEKDEVELLWELPQPGFGFAVLDQRGINKELAWASYGLCREHRFPEPSSAGPGVLGVRALGVAELVRQQNAVIVSRLEMAPIADDLLEETA